ncbi:hypothetical protein DXK94_03185 [Arthrobacter sp. RT-1]|uniref:hypothetical protein n=1 Tax=Arthrobacter sp. RT-1 TaxID=2292263 RepID=UPI000E1F5291|nr:hypothetical protein [Arthrobacter sp. RT-1]RDV12338.1 hypothetical protein DXK94_03185 [Arthrobacter sp. RT-1]
MYGEREEQDAIFNDSWKRLGWVEHQVETVRALCEPFLEDPKYPMLSITVDDSSSSKGHCEFTVDVQHLPELPQAVNFLIGNIVTDARSCLDMAMESIWKNYKLPRKGINVQFPLEGNYQEKIASNKQGDGLRRFIALLDDRFVEVIKRAQPDYAGGLVDIPANLSALFISHLSNANKHRNITPVFVRVALSMYGSDQSGLRLSLIGESASGVPPLRFSLEYDATQYSELDAENYIRALEMTNSGPLHITVTQKLLIDRQVIPLSPPEYSGQTIDWRAGLDDFLNNVPAYTRLTLRNLNRVHRVIQGGSDKFYLLDSDATL